MNRLINQAKAAVDSELIVIGAGNAGMCAAIAARQRGREVLVLERAPCTRRGGNSALTMNFRFPHEDASELLELIASEDRRPELDAEFRARYQPYSRTAFLDDLVSTSAGRCDMALARGLAEHAPASIAWLRSLGHRWTYKDPVNVVPRSVPVTLRGGGSALQEHNFRVAETLGIRILYGARLRRILEHQPGRVELQAMLGGRTVLMRAQSVVLACGGFEGNARLRAEFLGPEWSGVAMRGVPYNTGDGLLAALALGAARAGEWSSCHATPQRARLPQHMFPSENAYSQANSRYMFHLGITVNKDGQRFIDEGEDLPNLIYAKLGAAILRQPEQIAFQLFDHAMVGLLPDGYFKGGELRAADNWEALARLHGIDSKRLRATVDGFNKHAHDRARYGAPDGLVYAGQGPRKSNWACRLARPPYYIAPVRAGITFTYGGLRVDSRARVVSQADEPFSSLYACGEMAGGLFCGSYAGGSGMMLGAWLGRTAGMHA